MAHSRSHPAVAPSGSSAAQRQWSSVPVGCLWPPQLLEGAKPWGEVTVWKRSPVKKAWVLTRESYGKPRKKPRRIWIQQKLMIWIQLCVTIQPRKTRIQTQFKLRPQIRTQARQIGISSRNQDQIKLWSAMMGAAQNCCPKKTSWLCTENDQVILVESSKLWK